MGLGRDPQAGQLAFPSWPEHSAAPFQGADERICIVFHVRMDMA